MARAALTKLFILVILALIICLPEFFSLYRVSKVTFLCRPLRPCDRGDWARTGEYEDAEINRRDLCDPSRGHETWERACTLGHQSNGSEGEVKPRRGGGGGEPKDGWFMCRTDVDMAALRGNVSSVPKVHLEVSVNLELDDSGILNLTLYGRSNRSSLHLHAPEEEAEEEEEEEQDTMSDEGQEESFYCCLPGPPTPEPANRGRCLLWLANQTVSTARETLPWKRARRGEWLCMYRVLWLALVCVVLLTVVTAVVREVYWQRSTGRNPKVRTVLYVPAQNGKRNTRQNNTETPPKVNTIPRTCEPQHQSGLSPIPECEIQEEIETLVNGNVDNCYTAKLHHRGHPSTSSLTEEQVW